MAWDSYDEVLQYLFEQYEKETEPVSVDFRKLVDVSPRGKSRAMHLIHTYPAKLLIHIPYFFTQCNVLSQKNDLILDPFCGSGTVLLESILSGRRAIGADSNPLARLIAKVKSTHIETKVLTDALNMLVDSIPAVATTPIPNVVHVDYWFHKRVASQLHRIIEAIHGIENSEVKDFFLVCFSNCVKKVSLADLNVSVPVRLKVEKYSKDHRLYKEGTLRLKKLKNINAINEFTKIAVENIKRNAKINSFMTDQRGVEHIFSDSRSLVCESTKFKQPDESVQLIITSPPYAGAQKYIRASSLSLGWLGMCEKATLRSFEKKNIGREHYAKTEYSKLHCSGIKEADILLRDIFTINPMRAHIASNYLTEMRAAFMEMYRVLKPKGYLVLVVANNQVCGKEFRTQEYLQNIAESFGLKLKLRLIDDIHSRGLMTKRNKTASLISCEWVLVFQK